MKHLRYSTRYFHADLFLNNNCIVDNEIANDISNGWKYEKGIPILVGFLHKEHMDIFLAEEEDDLDFRKEVRRYITEKIDKNISMYAFNRHMEQGNFRGKWGWQVPMGEIKPFKGRGWNKDKFYNILLGQNIIPDAKITDVFDGDASQCIEYWRRYQDTGKIEHALKIVKHNMNCLMKESVILKYKQYFLDNYNLDEKGWVIE